MAKFPYDHCTDTITVIVKDQMETYYLSNSTKYMFMYSPQAGWHAKMLCLKSSKLIKLFSPITCHKAISPSISVW